ncbi:MAG: hypothetical protein V4750_02835 [Pseudomonadota bacterium]
MSPAAPAKRASYVLSDSTLVPLGFVVVVVVAFLGMAKWVGRIDAQQEADREFSRLILDQMRALTLNTARASEDAAATRAQVQMIVRELDRTK